MSGGRPRKPAAVKKLEGNRGKKKIPPEPRYAQELPEPPAFLKGVGLKEWRRLGPMMLWQGVLTAADWAPFTAYCSAVQRRWEIERALGSYSPFNGRKNPELEDRRLDEWHRLDRALDRAEKQMMKAITELGLSPVTRSKAAREKPRQADEFEQFDGLHLVDGAKK